MKMIIVTFDELKTLIRNELQSFKPEPSSPVKRYTVEESAKYLGLPVPSFRIHQNRIGGTKIGKRWFFSQKELEQFIELNRRKTLREIREEV